MVYTLFSAGFFNRAVLLCNRYIRHEMLTPNNNFMPQQLAYTSLLAEKINVARMCSSFNECT